MISSASLINRTSNYLAHASVGSLVLTTVCMAPVVEGVYGAGKNLIELFFNRADKNTSDHLSRNIASTVFYGMCVARVIPGSALIGTLLFFGNAVTHTPDETSYKSTKALNLFAQKCIDPVLTKIVKHVLTPVCKLICDVVEGLFKCIGNVLSLIPLPNNPIWYGVAALTTAGVIYRVVILKTPPSL